MELLYVWIEDYKNIKKQGFNFSPKHWFDFEYEEDKEGTVIGGTLHHEERNSNYPKDFFGENISNVTAIVGKNGSGKSNLTEYLIEIIRQSECTSEYNNLNNFTLVFKSSIDKIRIISSIFKTNQINLSSNNKIPLTTEYKHLSELYLPLDLKFLFLSSNINRRLSSINIPHSFFETQQIDLSNITLLEDYNLDQVHYQDILNITSILYENAGTFFNFFKHPKYLTIEVQHDNIVSDYYHEADKKEVFLEKFCRSLLKNIQSISDIILQDEISKILENGTFNDILEYIHRNIDSDLTLYNILSDALSKDITVSGIIFYDLDNNADKLHFEQLRTKLNKFIKDKPWIDLSKIFKIDWQYKSENTQTYKSPLSYGELTKASFLARMYQNIKLSEKEYFVLIFDETSIGYHPQWQKHEIYSLIEFLNTVFPTKFFQVLITSHSPFLISDLPKDNIIFLNKKENGECEVKQPEDMTHTFGANIHSLYRNSFFLENGLMGEFAKGKIDQVIRNLSNEQLNEKEKMSPEDIQFVIQQIGEPLIKNKLQQMYDQHFHFDLEDRIKQLEKEVADLKKRRK
ncbi:AAA family ATPase [Marinifilum fragile]|uniref:AAA family ATPase n=1 Tax=Marinifilum fragile TaxID=570161 RepID=UPI002AA6AAF3|nr:AAA family ATPase [Marinifilum fragile]